MEWADYRQSGFPEGGGPGAQMSRGLSWSQCPSRCVSSTLGPQSLALSSCTGVHHVILWIVPKGIYLSPKIKAIHPSIHPLFFSVRQGLFSESTSCHVKVTSLSCKYLFSRIMLAHLGTIQLRAFTDPPRVPSLVRHEF